MQTKSKSGSKSKSRSTQTISVSVSNAINNDPTLLNSNKVQSNNNFRISTINRTNLKGEKISYPLLVPEYDFEDVITNPKAKSYAISKTRYNNYYAHGMYPYLQYYRSNNSEVVPLEFFTTLPKKIAISEKPEYVADNEVDSVPNTKGNQLQTRALNFRFYGIFSQLRGRTDRSNTPDQYARHLYITEEVRADDDEIGHLIAFQNNMYALQDPYAQTLVVKRDGKDVKIRPDPILVNRALVKSIFDSIGFEQGKIIVSEYGKYLDEKDLKLNVKSKSGVFSYRDLKGDNPTLNITEQNMAITHFFAPSGATIFATTPTSEIRFIVSEEKLEAIDLESGESGKIYFKPHPTAQILIDETKGSRLITSDELLTASVKKYNMKATTAQATAESLYRQGYITYPRVNEESNQIEDTGIEVKINLEDFDGSNEERKILTVINEANKALADGLPYLIDGKWVLEIGNDVVAFSEPTNVFYDEERSFEDEQFDLVVKEQGKTNAELTDYLITNDIGTKATRTPQLEELIQAGIVTTEFQDRNEIYRLDTRGLFMAAGFDYMEENKGKSVIKLGNKVKKSESLEEIVQIWNDYDPIDIEKFRNHIVKKSSEYLESEAELAIIDAL